MSHIFFHLITQSNYYITWVHLVIVSLLFVLNVKSIKNVIKIKNKEIFFLAILLFVSISLRLYPEFIQFGYGNNIQETLNGYSLYTEQKWIECEGGTINECMYYVNPNYPIGHSFFMSVLFQMFGFPLHFQDAVLSFVISILSVILMFFFSKLLFRNLTSAFISSFLFAISHFHVSMTMSKETAIFNIFFMLLSQTCLLLFFRIKNIGSFLLMVFTIVWSFLWRPSSIITVSFITLLYLFLYKNKSVKIIKKLNFEKKKIVWILIIIIVLLLLLNIGISVFIGGQNINSQFTHRNLESVISHIVFFFNYVTNPGYLFLIVLSAICFLEKKKLKQKSYLLLWNIIAWTGAILYPGEPNLIPIRHIIVSYIPLFILSGYSFSYSLKLFTKNKKKKALFAVAVLALLGVMYYNIGNIFYGREDINTVKQYELSNIVKDYSSESLFITTKPHDARLLIIHDYNSFWCGALKKLDEILPIIDKRVFVIENIFETNNVSYEYVGILVKKHSLELKETKKTDNFILYEVNKKT